MKTSEKLEYINNLIDKINNKVLVNKDFKFKFDNTKGANNYCILIIREDKELFCGAFGTYDNVINCLDLIKTMFNIAIKDIKNKK